MTGGALRRSGPPPPSPLRAGRAAGDERSELSGTADGEGVAAVLRPGVDTVLRAVIHASADRARRSRDILPRQSGQSGQFTSVTKLL